MAPVLDELCRQQRDTAALAAVSEVLGHFGADADGAMRQLDAALGRMLPDAGSGDGDPSGLAKLVLSARNRVQPARRPQAMAAQGVALLALAALVVMASIAVVAHAAFRQRSPGQRDA